MYLKTDVTKLKLTHLHIFYEPMKKYYTKEAS